MNDRHRKRNKLNYRYLIRKCPCCHKQMYRDSWHEDIGCVETIERCDNCGYLHHWSYGATQLCIGKKEYGFSYSDQNGGKIFKKFRTAVKRYRRKYHYL